jgi:hypothetical protein
MMFTCLACGNDYYTDLTHVDGVPITEWWRRRGQRCAKCIRLGRAQGVQRRDAGMALAVAHSPESYREVYAEEFERVLQRGEPFCSDQIVRVVGISPNPNAVGGIFNGLLRANKGRIVTAGTAQMERPGAHARLTRLYRLRTDVMQGSS